MKRLPPLQILGLAGVGEVPAGADVASLLVDALHAQRANLVDGDVLVVSSKIVSKAAGLVVGAPVEPVPDAADTIPAPAEPAARSGTRSAPVADPPPVPEPLDRDLVVLSQSVRRVAARRGPGGTTRIVQALAGPVMAAAGVDASNVGPDRADALLLLPADPDAAARDLRTRLAQLTGARVAVVISDTAGRPWREGQTDLALGCAGLVVLEDLRGAADADGRALAVTARALADEIAAAADLVKGKSTGIPAALLRGLADLVTDEDGPGARVLLRPAESDWFRLGHVEAVRASIGAEAVEPPPLQPGPVADRLHRVAAVASADGGDCIVRKDRLHLLAENQFALGALAQRVRSALWTEGLRGRLDHDTPRGGLRGRRAARAHVVIRPEPLP